MNMKITIPVLESLGAKRIDQRTWELNGFKLIWLRTVNVNIPSISSYDVWSFNPRNDDVHRGHPVTDVDEMIRFAYYDGHDDGRNSFRKDFKDLFKME